MPSRLVERIVVIGLSNIGDGVLMAPVIARLHARYPKARLTLFVGERARQVYVQDPRVHELVSFDAYSGWWGRVRLVGAMWRLHPDCFVDLRHTLLPIVVNPWYVWRYLWAPPARLVHRRDRHLWYLSRQVPECALVPDAGQASALSLTAQEHAHTQQLLQRAGVHGDRAFVVICPGARSELKRWAADRFAVLADGLINQGDVEVLFSGEPDEAPIIDEIRGAMRHQAISMVGRLTIRQTAALMSRARLVITNDSASLHVACAMRAPVLALFGPTDARKYGPTGPRDRVIRRRLFCAPCEQALCRFNHECLRFIGVEDVLEAAAEMVRAPAVARHE